MNLDQLQLNRRLYRKTNKNDSTDPTDSVSLSQYNTTPPPPTPLPSTAIAPGTVVQSCTWQTSPGDDRIELTPDDKLTSYENGDIRTQMTRNGTIVYKNGDRVIRLFENGLIVDSLNTTDPMFEVDANSGLIDIYRDNGDIISEWDESTGYEIYNNTIRPEIYGGYYDVATDTSVLPPGWSHTTASFDVTFTFPTSTNTMYVTVTPIAAHFRAMVTTVTATSFTVSMQQSIYGSGTYSVTGGGGGSVTIPSGIYQGEDNNTLSSFYFTAVRYVV